MITYPEGLPIGLRQGRAYQTANMIMRTELESGRSRYRRTFTSVPVQASVSWLFNSVQARLFENFFKEALSDGILEFECPLRTTLGLDFHIERLTAVYQGPAHAGFDLWSFSATLELRDRPILPGDWTIVPTFVLRPDIFDRAMNREWPEP